MSDSWNQKNIERIPTALMEIMTKGAAQGDHHGKRQRAPAPTNVVESGEGVAG